MATPPKARASGTVTAVAMQKLFITRLAQHRATLPQYFVLIPGEAKWRAAYRAWEKREADLALAAAGGIIFRGMTRDGLQQAVRTDAVRVVAKRYGLSDNGLRKVCIKYKINMPRRGYWARRRAKIKA